MGETPCGGSTRSPSLGDVNDGTHISGPDAPTGWRGRVAGWLDSDLVGVAATGYTFLVLMISLAIFRFGGPIAGIIVAIGLWVPMVVFVIRGWGRPPRPLDFAPAPPGAHRVLVVANRGLEEPEFCDVVCRRGERFPAQALILAPAGSAGLHGLADDVDAEVAAATKRIEAVVATLQGRGVAAAGHADIADPMQALLDGLRQFPANEVVMVPASEHGWGDAEDLAARVREEAGVPVTVLGSSGSGARAA